MQVCDSILETRPRLENIYFASAGVPGLATALRLRQSGHRVTVVDKGIGPSEVVCPIIFRLHSPFTIVLPQRKGGAHLPPNATKLLIEWGLGRQLKRHGLPIRASIFLSGVYLPLLLRHQGITKIPHSQRMMDMRSVASNGGKMCFKNQAPIIS